MPARIEDVAAHAGVSTKTVSRVLNGYASVRAKLRTRIEASIRALNYVPNASARSLAGNRSYLVALLYDNPMAGSSYTMEVIVGVLQACKGTPYNAVLHPFDAADDLAARIDGLNRQMDVVAATVWHRLVEPGARPALARTFVFHASDRDLQAMIDIVSQELRERAIAADAAFDATGDGARVGLTFAAAPLEEDR